MVAQGIKLGPDKPIDIKFLKFLICLFYCIWSMISSQIGVPSYEGVIGTRFSSSYRDTPAICLNSYSIQYAGPVILRPIPFNMVGFASEMKVMDTQQ